MHKLTYKQKTYQQTNVQTLNEYTNTPHLLFTYLHKITNHDTSDSSRNLFYTIYHIFLNFVPFYKKKSHIQIEKLCTAHNIRLNCPLPHAVQSNIMKNCRNICNKIPSKRLDLFL